LLFREVNERIRDVSQSWAEASEPVEFLCECGHGECSELLGLTIADYDEVRSAPNRFMLLRGHEAAELAVINGYSIAERRGAEAGNPPAAAPPAA
jgi:hypothetical protein